MQKVNFNWPTYKSDTGNETLMKIHIYYLFDTNFLKKTISSKSYKKLVGHYLKHLFGRNDKRVMTKSSISQFFFFGKTI